MMTINKYKLKVQRVRSMPASMNGLTLVEMMIAMVLGLAMMAGIVALYVNVNETAAYLNTSSRIQENGRFAVDQIVRTLRMAGYENQPTSVNRPTLVLEGKLVKDGKLGSVTSINGFTIQEGSHAVLVKYEGAKTIVNTKEHFVRDCQGREVWDNGVDKNTEDIWVTNTYAIAAIDISNHVERPEEFGLVCTTAINGGTPNTATFIAEGVEGMEIYYGIDSPVVDGVADRYHNSDTYTKWTDEDWKKVVSAKLALLVNSVERIKAGTIDANSNSNFRCESCTTFTPADDFVDDYLLRAEFQATVRFRNPLGVSSP